MGSVTEDETAVLLELSKLSSKAKLHLMHHIGNSLNVITLAAHLGDKGKILKSVDHIIDDMKQFGCFEMHGGTFFGFGHTQSKGGIGDEHGERMLLAGQDEQRGIGGDGDAGDRTGNDDHGNERTGDARSARVGS